MIDYLKVIFTIPLLVAPIFGLALALGGWSQSIACEEKASVMRLSYEWGFFKGCIIELKDGRKIPIDMQRFIKEVP